MPLVSADWLADDLGHVVVVDCRWSLTEPGAGRRAYEAGHIPGARNVPFAQPLDDIAAALGPAGDTVAYCGSGVSASTLVLAAAAGGRDVRLYPGSWSQWCARGLPVERGDPS